MANQLTPMDRIFNEIFSGNTGFPVMSTKSSNYPPINISELYESKDSIRPSYFIEVALAGFTREEIDLSMETITSNGQSYNVINVKASKSSGRDIQYQHNGIAYRDVDKCIAVSNQDIIDLVTYVDGILLIELRREDKPRNTKSIPIS